jgi:hypothetical protein
MNIGCYILDALLSSSFFCLYHRPCFAHLMYYIKTYNGQALQITSIQHNLTTRYEPITNVSTILKHLMIEKWNFHTSYKKYFQACNPSICTYTYVLGHDWVYIITILLSSTGGLTVIFRYIVPIIILLKYKWADTRRRRRRRVRIEAFDQPTSP